MRRKIHPSVSAGTLCAGCVGLMRHPLPIDVGWSPTPHSSWRASRAQSCSKPWHVATKSVLSIVSLMMDKTRLYW